MAVEETNYGFSWDGILVERMAEVSGHHMLRIRTDRRDVVIRVTPTGLIRMVESKLEDCEQAPEIVAQPEPLLV